jgi:hypothetical protein
MNDKKRKIKRCKEEYFNFIKGLHLLESLLMRKDLF